MQDDKQFRVSGGWALASDGCQWVVQKWEGKRWRSLKYIRSDKAWLAHRLTKTLKVPPADAAKLLDGLPDTFDQWIEAVHDVFGKARLPKPPPEVKTNQAPSRGRATAKAEKGRAA
jgi:hypothetical protein